MTWSYRVIDHGEWFGLHEVFYDKQGVARSYTTEPISFQCDASEGEACICASLEMALSDMMTKPALKVSDFGQAS